MKRIGFICLFLWSYFGATAEVIPPAPKQYFNDYAGAVSTATASRLNQTLENFERQNSSQIVVAVFSKMQSESSIEDYTVRVAEAWKVGQKEKNNGAVLFLFVQDRKMFIQVGYGLEGALPDAICKRIISDEIIPHLKAGDYDGGLSAGVNAILAATKGEYKGSGHTVGDTLRNLRTIVPPFLCLFVVLLIFVLFLRGGRFGRGYSAWTIGSGGSSGGWSGGGGFSSGGGGGFSGGGGSFGGGGAGGSW